MGFKIIKTIGSGSFGTVYLVQNDSLNNFALKRINLNELAHNDFRRQLHEISVLFFNKCPYLLKGLDINIINSHYLDIVTPYYDGGTLDNFISLHKSTGRKINPEVILDLFTDIAIGLKYLHANDIIHRDIKPANILVDHKSNQKVQPLLILVFLLFYLKEILITRVQKLALHTLCHQNKQKLIVNIPISVMCGL